MTTKYIINAGAAIVSRKIVERTGNIKRLIREEPFAPQDTGWRILSDRDTDEYLADPATASKETQTPQSRSANTPMSRAAWRRRLSRVHNATPGVTTALARSATSTALRPLPHRRRSSTRCRTPRSSTLRTIIKRSSAFRKIDRFLRFPNASSVMTL